MDAEYFHPSYLELEKVLEFLIEKSDLKIVSLRSISSRIRKGIFSILKTEYKDQGIPFIRVSNIKNLMIDENNLTFISEERNNDEKKTSLQPRDIVVSKGGTIGEVAIIPNYMPMVNISQDVIGISIKTRKILPEYVCIYLASWFGKRWFERNRSRLTHPHLELRPVRDLPVPIIPDDKQQMICNWVNKSIEKYSEARKFYREALHKLDVILGLENYNPRRQRTFQVTFSDIENMSGWSSEQHLPDYSELLDEIKKSNYPLMKFGDIITVSSRKVKPKDTPSKKFCYIELSNISPTFGNIESYSKVLGHKAPSRAKMLLSKGDVLIPYLRGSFDKISIVTNEYHGMVGSTGFYVVRSKAYESWFLLALLRSRIFQSQLQQRIAGTIMQSVSLRSLKKIQLPKIPRQMQNDVGDLIRESYESLKKSQKSIKRSINYVENFLKKRAHITS